MYTVYIYCIYIYTVYIYCIYIYIQYIYTVYIQYISNSRIHTNASIECLDSSTSKDCLDEFRRRWGLGVMSGVGSSPLRGVAMGDFG